MATHSSILAWRIPWTEEPGGLQSMGAQRVGPEWATSLTEAEKQNPREETLLSVFTVSVGCVCLTSG